MVCGGFLDSPYWAFRSYRGCDRNHPSSGCRGEVRTSSAVLLPHEPSSVAIARQCLTAELIAVGVLESVIDDVNVIISELMSNALRHARPLPSGQVRLAWSTSDDAIEIAVCDGGARTEPRRGHPTLSSLGGRGLGIVETIAECWGVDHDHDGTTVWAVLRSPQLAGPPPRAGADRPQAAITVQPSL
jgi:anti-sigma regulatory factor (Ser/Thr protein kinase)